MKNKKEEKKVKVICEKCDTTWLVLEGEGAPDHKCREEKDG